MERMIHMKRKLFCIAMALALTLLAACGGGKPASSGGQAGSGAQGSQSAAPAASGGAEAASSQEAGGWRCAFRTAQGAEIAVNDDMAAALDALGEPQSYFEAESCAFEGLDKTYTYPGFVITTRPEGDKDFINSIRLTDDSVTTPEGLYIGSTADEVTAVYGESAGEQENYLTFVQDGLSLNFLLENGAVTSIEYLPA